MIILPDHNVPRAKFLMPVLDKEWRTPSLTQPKDQFGNENTTRFRIRAKSNDGTVIWTGFFSDRDDFDAFLYSIAIGTLKQEKVLWNLPTPNWQPYLDEIISYDFAGIINLTTPTASLQTWNKPSDWTNTNIIETIGGGGGGASVYYDGFSGAGFLIDGGAGGGAYSKITNLSLGSTASYQIGKGGDRQNINNTLNTLGGDSWFNGSTLAGSSVGSKGGVGTPGYTITNTTRAGSAGGSAASGTGTTKYSGGTGGTGASTGNPDDGKAYGGGGGGAGGPNGNGSNGSTWTGGSGNGSPAGSGGNGERPAFPYNFNTPYDGFPYGGGVGGRGLNFPAGSYSSSSTGHGAGAQGVIVLTYYPKVVFFNMPNLGM